jgi:hypothetical protein
MEYFKTHILILLLNRGEIYQVAIEICRNLHTFMYFLPTILPCSASAQGDIVGREYIKVCKFLQISIATWYVSPRFNNSCPN